MKVIGSILAFMIVGSVANAAVQNLVVGQVYTGREVVNQQSTGKVCYVAIQKVEPNSGSGLHCHAVEFVYASTRTDLPKYVLRVGSRITNAHRAEYPMTRTCAMNIDGSTFGDEIYGDDTLRLFIRIFAGRSKAGGAQYDYFLNLSPQTKEAVSAGIHIQHFFSETEIECIGLVSASSQVSEVGR